MTGFVCEPSPPVEGGVRGGSWKTKREKVKTLSALLQGLLLLATIQKKV